MLREVANAVHGYAMLDRDERVRLKEQGVKLNWCSRAATARGEWWHYCERWA